jgi:hypothetical protein
LVAGAIGSIVAPWVHWSIEKRKLKLEYRKSQIGSWRSFLEGFDWQKEEFGNTSVYGAMRPYISADIVKRFEAPRTYYASPDGGRGSNLKKQWASDEITRIEKEWGLL